MMQPHQSRSHNIRETFFFFPSNSKKCADRDELGLADLSVEHGPHDGVEGALGDEVVHVDRGRLADAVRPVLGLLHVPGVPVELGEHHVAGGRQGQTLLEKNGDTQARAHTHTLAQMTYSELQGLYLTTSCSQTLGNNLEKIHISSDLIRPRPLYMREKCETIMFKKNCEKTKNFDKGCKCIFIGRYFLSNNWIWMK